MKKLIFVILISLLTGSKLYSQSCQIIINDSVGITTRIFEDGNKISYASHELIFRIDTVLRNNPNHINDVNNFLNSINSRIAFFNADNPPLNTSNGTGIILLSDTMDAFEYINVIYQSGLFINIELNGAGELNDVFFNPNDPKFNEQWYLKQSNNKDIPPLLVFQIRLGGLHLTFCKFIKILVQTFGHQQQSFRNVSSYNEKNIILS